MLINLDWLQEGKPYPPKAEADRIRRYKENEKLFLGQHVEVFGPYYKKLEDQLKRRSLEPSAVFNYPQLLTKKTADFVCGEPILIESDKEEDVKKLQAALDEMNFDSLLYEAIMDVSRFGDAPIKLMNDRLSSIAPEYWFPIVDDTDLKHIKQHVIAFPTSPDDKGVFKEIYVEIHSVGSVEVRRYAAYEGSFGKLVADAEVIQTGLDDFAIKVLKNVSHSKSIFGIDDYAIINSLVQALIWRMHCINIVLDKHSEPSLTGPEKALTYDQKTGMYYLDLGNYFKRATKDDPNVEYLTWDGNIDSSFKEIEVLLNQIYILSEMGAAFTDGRDHGQVSSGTALKLRLVSPRIKAQRIAGVNTRTLRQALGLIAKVKGISLEAADIAVTWNDGLPSDPREDIEVMLAANGGLPVESQLSTTKRWNDFDDAEAAKMLKQMRTEQTVNNPYWSGGENNDAEREVQEEV